jgi:hypothetical protein
MRKEVADSNLYECQPPLFPLRASFLMADSNLYECQPPLHFVPLFSHEVGEVAAHHSGQAATSPLRATSFAHSSPYSKPPLSALHLLAANTISP